MKTKALITFVLALAVAGSPASAKPRGTKADRNKTPPAAEAGINHTVKPGETLFSIAEKYYGNGYEWVRLKEYQPWVDPDHLVPGEVIHVPDAPYGFRGGSGMTSLDLPSGRSLFAWMPTLGNVSLFGRSLNQVILILLVWFVLHFSIQGLFVWFAAHLAFVKDVSMKKAMRATLQSESLALICVVMAAVVGLMLLYVGTTSPGKPVTADLLSTAEEYLGSPSGIAIGGMLLVSLYGFLGIRFIPPAFGIQPGRGVAIVMVAILVPHLIGFYLLGHRMGLLN
jgi:hypothetical protein